MDIKENLEIIKDIVFYWYSQILEKSLYFIIALAISIFIVWCLFNGNQFGRYFDPWMN
jgi:hypothetical protein